MPNFKASINFDKINEYFTKANDSNKVKFNFITKEQNGIMLVHTSVENKSFFIQLKRQNNHHLIKLDKHSRIDDLAVMIFALKDFEEKFCDEIIHSTLGFKKPKLSSNVISIDELLNKINQYKKIILEIGFGSARQMLYQAKTNDKDTLIIGIEIYKPSILQASRLLACYENVVLLNDDARFILDILPKDCIDMLLLHFPVPWNDSKTRRVISDEFFKNLSYVLKKDGVFWLRTDDEEYFQDAKKMLSNFDIKTNINTKDNITSKYEARWLKMNKNIYDIYAKNTLNTEKKPINFSLDGIIAKKIPSQKIVGDEYFLNIEKSYDIWFSLKDFTRDDIMLKISYGSFTKPFHSYIIKDVFLFNKPYLCHQNLAALSKLKELLKES